MHPCHQHAADALAHARQYPTEYNIKRAIVWTARFYVSGGGSIAAGLHSAALRLKLTEEQRP